MNFQVRGRSKSADQILMSIRALCLEWETRIAHLHPISEDTKTLLSEIRKCWGASTGIVADVWQDKIKEIELEIIKRSKE